MALVVLSVLEQRLDAVRAVLAGADVTEVAARLGVHRSTVHRWLARYLSEQLAGLADRSHRPASCPHQAPTAVEVAVAEMRRQHPRWGSRRIRLEMLRKPVAGVAVPAERTIDRILIRSGLLRARPRKRPKASFVRFERPGPMQLWGIDIVGGVQLVDPRTGEMRDAKLVTGVDDHSRFCVIAAVVERATSRAVCLAFAQALARFGVPEEVITDNGKQFTDRFGQGGEVLFDKICRHNGITHRLTAPSSPNQNGKVERFHGTFRPDFLTDAEPFVSVDAAQQAVDAWVEQYNTTDRPHQGLDPRLPVTPADRFTPAPDAERALVDLWLPRRWNPSQVASLRRRRRRRPAWWVARSSWRRKSRRRGTCPWPGSSSGSDPPALASGCGSGSTATWSTCPSAAPASRPSGRTSASPTWPASPLTAPDQPDLHPCRPPQPPTGWSRSNEPCPGPAPSPSAVTSCWPRKSSPAVRSGSGSKARRCSSSTSTPVSCCAPDPTQSRPAKPKRCAAFAPSARHRGQRLSRSPSNAAPRTPGS